MGFDRVDRNMQIVSDLLIGLALGGHHGQRKFIGRQQAGHLVGGLRIMDLGPSASEANPFRRSSYTAQAHGHGYVFPPSLQRAMMSIKG